MVDGRARWVKSNILNLPEQNHRSGPLHYSRDGIEVTHQRGRRYVHFGVRSQPDAVKGQGGTREGRCGWVWFTTNHTLDDNEGETSQASSTPPSGHYVRSYITLSLYAPSREYRCVHFLPGVLGESQCVCISDCFREHQS